MERIGGGRLDVFDSTGVPRGQRFDLFYAAVMGRIGRMTPTRPATTDDFRSRIVSRSLGGYSAHLITAPSHDAYRAPADILSDGRDDLHVTMMLRGERAIEIADHVASTGPGMLFIAPSWRPHVLRGVGARYSGFRLALPTTPAERWRVERALARRGALAQGPLAPVLRAICLAIARNLRTMPDRELAVLIGAVVRLVSLSLKHAEDARVSDGAAALYERVLVELEAAASDWELDLGVLARTLGTSPRGIQRALAAHGETFSGLLRRIRLERARRALVEGGASVERVAFDSGYSELSAFYRAFRRSYGVTPATLRAPGR